MTGELLGAETRHDRRAPCGWNYRHDRRAGLWMELGMTGGLLVAVIMHDRRAVLWLELGMTGGLSFGWN
jgi:hypothetical protein